MHRTNPNQHWFTLWKARAKRLTQMQKCVHGFVADTRGNFALISALVAAIFILPAAGLTVDYSRLNNTKFKLQEQLDATTLAIAAQIDPEVLKSGSDDRLAAERARLEPIAKNYFDALMAEHNFLTKYSSFAVDLQKGYVEISVVGNVPLTFGSFLGSDKSKISTLARAGYKAETAQDFSDLYFTFDHSTSMIGKPEKNLRKAAKAFIKTLYKAKADITISIVPYYQVGVNRGFYIHEKRLLKKKGAIISFINKLHAANSAYGSGKERYRCSSDTMDGLFSLASKKEETSVFVLMTDLDGYCNIKQLLKVCKKIRAAGHRIVAIQFGYRHWQKPHFIDCAGGEKNYAYVSTSDDIFNAFINAGTGEPVVRLLK